MPMDDEREGEVRALLRETLKTQPVDPARAARVRDAVRAEWLQHRQPRPARWRVWAAAGAAAAALVAYVAWPPAGPATAPPANAPVATVRFVTGAVLGRRDARAPREALRVGDVLRAGAEFSTDGSTTGTVVLADGVEVRIGGRTRLVFQGGRRLDLQFGDVYVDSGGRRGPGAGMPVEIATAGSLIRDIGTRFAVHGGSAVTIRVREGRVQLDRGGALYEAGPGERVEVASDGRVRVSQAPLFGPDWDWILQAAPPPSIDGRPLGEFLQWASRESGRAIRFADPSVERASSATVVYGAIAGLSVEEALEVVLPSCGLTHRIDGGVITIAATDEARGAR